MSANGTSGEGFDAEWREITILTFEGDLISRCEIFDEADIDTALARFDELSSQAPRLENAASQMDKRIRACFAARDWDAMAAMLAQDVFADDRRRVVGAGVRHGRNAEIDNLRASRLMSASRASRQTSSRSAGTASSSVVFVWLAAISGPTRSEPRYSPSSKSMPTNGSRQASRSTRRHRRRVRRARCPLPRRRGGPPRAHMVACQRGLCRVQSTGVSSDHFGLGEHRPPARDVVRARRRGPVRPCRVGRRARRQHLHRGCASAEQPRCGRHLRR